MVGADGPRDYLLVFQNNAEIRATGGLPGAWARVHAQDGKLTIVEQGAGGDFGERATPVLALSKPERAVYGQVTMYARMQTRPITAKMARAVRIMA